MKKLILFAGLITCLSSCGLFQKVHKEKAIVKVETKQEAKKDSTGITVDKTITTTIEKVALTLLLFPLTALIIGMHQESSTQQEGRN